MMSLSGFDHQWHDDGEGNLIHESAVINWEFVKIGTGNVIGPGVCIGTDAQHITKSSDGIITIGNNNIIREYTTIHLPTAWSKLTAIEDNCYLMVNANIAHDCYIESNCIISNNAAFGGHVYVMKNTNIGYSVSIHQFQVIGSYCMLGMGTIITSKQHVAPGGLWYGNPGKSDRQNTIGLERRTVTDKMLEEETIRMESIKLERSKYKYDE